MTSTSTLRRIASYLGLTLLILLVIPFAAEAAGHNIVFIGQR